MSESPLTDYLDHIAQAAADARSFIEDQSKDGFLSDKRTQRAVVMSLVIVGEAATKTMERYPDFVARHPEVPWAAACAVCATGSPTATSTSTSTWSGTPCKRLCLNCWIVSLPSGKTPRRTMPADRDHEHGKQEP